MRKDKTKKNVFVVFNVDKKKKSKMTPEANPEVIDFEVVLS